MPPRPPAMLLLALLALAARGAHADGHGACEATMSVEITLPVSDAASSCQAATPGAEKCPAAFPSFAAADEPPTGCAFAVVGAGTGGLYFATRLVEEGKVAAADVCVFETTSRVGGRMYSLRGLGPKNDLVVDAGAYRTWPRYTPVTHALVERLGLATECYDLDMPLADCQVFNVVKQAPNGQGDHPGTTTTKAGFATIPETLAANLFASGARFYPQHKLVSLGAGADGGAASLLTFANGVEVQVGKMGSVLNVPQRPLLEILRNSNVPGAPIAKTLDGNLYRALHSVQGEIVVKLYLHYETAWWYELGLKQGDFTSPGDAGKILLNGRYHDGHVICDKPGGKCRGMLLAIYKHDYAGEVSIYFRRFQKDPTEAMTLIDASTPEGANFLKDAHARLVEYHTYEKPVSERNYTAYEVQKHTRQPPTFATLAVWGNDVTGAEGGGWHGWTDLQRKDLAMAPLKAHNVSVVNEAFSNVQGWAEGSLQLADEVLRDAYGVKAPWSFEVPDVTQRVAQTVKPECDAVVQDFGGGSLNLAEEDSHICFAPGTLVRMADGSTKRIEDVRAGDSVSGGSGRSGKVTAALVHDAAAAGGKAGAKLAVVAVVYREADGVEVAVGTKSHPVLASLPGGRGLGWVELAELTEEALSYAGEAAERPTLGAGLAVRLERRVVPAWHNLEVDGPEEGAPAPAEELAEGERLRHAYALGAEGLLVASGLGDHPALNARHQRQKAFQQAGGVAQA